MHPAGIIGGNLIEEFGFRLKLPQLLAQCKAVRRNKRNISLVQNVSTPQYPQSSLQKTQRLSPTSNLSSCMHRTIKYLFPRLRSIKHLFSFRRPRQYLLICKLTVDTSTIFKLALDDRVNVHSKSGARSVGFAAGVFVDELVDSLAIFVVSVRM